MKIHNKFIKRDQIGKFLEIQENKLFIYQVSELTDSSLNSLVKFSESSVDIHPLVAFKLLDWAGINPKDIVKEEVRVEYKNREHFKEEEVHIPVAGASVKYGKVLFDGNYYTRTEALIKFSRRHPKAILQIIPELDKLNQKQDRIYYETKYLIYQNLSRDLSIRRPIYTYITKTPDGIKIGTTKRPTRGMYITIGNFQEELKDCSNVNEVLGKKRFIEI